MSQPLPQQHPELPDWLRREFEKQPAPDRIFNPEPAAEPEKERREEVPA